MKFHLNYSPQKLPFELEHRDRVFFCGSCFAENIAARMEERKFQITHSPSGILFNPESIRLELERIISQKETGEQFLLEREQRFYSLFAHSSLYADSKEQIQNLLRQKHREAQQALKEAKVLVLSFGTAMVFRHKQLNTVVGNCHKLPQQDFEKQMLLPDEIVENYFELLSDLQTLNPQLHILFTVSPVKYLREGLEVNALSKASLLLAVHKLVKAFPFCHYFPAFELLTDDLRDYRFYKEDLAHPNAQAIHYIWEKFSQSVFSEKTLQLIAEIEKLNRALQHRQMGAVMDPKLEEFVVSQKRKILSIEPGLGL